MSAMSKTTFREIKHSLGRFLAILAIVALGVGFFSGLKITKSAMLDTCDSFLKDSNLFDFRIISTVGFDEEDLNKIAEYDAVETAEKSFTKDFLYLQSDGSSAVIKAHSITREVNKLTVVSGRLPQSDNECIGDYRMFAEADIGNTVKISDANTDEVRNAFKYGEYTLVGLAISPYYLNFERGTTTLGTGKVTGYIYINYSGFSEQDFGEIFVKLRDANGYVFSDGYENAVDGARDGMETLCDGLTLGRYNELMSDAESEISQAKEDYEKAKSEAYAELDAALSELDDAKNEINANREKLNAMKSIVGNTPQIAAALSKLDEAEKELQDGYNEYQQNKDEVDSELNDALEKINEAQDELDDTKRRLNAQSLYYVLDRNTNVGYVCFKNDSEIVDGISTVFPVFFFFVAALVCMTTMSRMIEEQRTQIGVLKALGYGPYRIMSKYVFYSGSAALIGCIAGYSVGIIVFPYAIWNTYSILYGFSDVRFAFSLPLALISIAVSLVCSVGTTYVSCRKEMMEVPAQLIRPKAPKSGKRILLERFTPLWKRLSFLHKVSARNIFRYKKRFVMMVLGISGCTALLLTGLGLRDSIATIAADHFERIVKYDFSVSFVEKMTSSDEKEFIDYCGDKVKSVLFVNESSMEIKTAQGSKTITVIAFQNTEGSEDFIDLHENEKKIASPQIGEAVLTRKFAELNSIDRGDTVTLVSSDMRELKFTVTDICDNYVFNYIYINHSSFESQWGTEMPINTAYVNISDSLDVHEVSAFAANYGNASGVTVNRDVRERFENMIKSLDYIVALIIFCAAALAFIVLYNLTNISINERKREIATLKVLGFRSSETYRYVFREGLVLTGIGCALGLILGVWLHRFVMVSIDMDFVSFNIHIVFLSFFLSVILTFAFAIIVNTIMQLKIEKINMAESLKSIE